MLVKLRVLWSNFWILAFVVALVVVIAYGFSVFARGGRPADTASLAAGATPSAGSATGYPAPGLTPLPVMTVITDPALLPPPPSRTSPTVVGPVLSPIPMPTSTYITKSVLAVTRGSGPGQVGIEGQEGDPSGPTNFTTDLQGNVYLIDQVNARVNRYDPAGKFLSSFSFGKEPPGPIMVDIAVWKDGSVFLADEVPRFEDSDQRAYQTVFRYNLNGKVLLTYKWWGVSSITRVRVDPAGEVWAEGIHERTSFTVAQLGTVDVAFGRDQVQATEKAGMMLPQGVVSGRLLALAQDKKAAVVSLTLDEGRIINLQTPAHPDPAALFANNYLLAADRAGNLYELVCYFLPNSSSDCRIIVYDKVGKATNQVALNAPPPYSVPRMPYYVDWEGRVYMLQTFKDGVKVVEWEKES